jgi:para-nitrobenzyl esterase
MSITPYELLTAIQSDAMFRVPLIKVAEAQIENKQKAFNFLFTWQSPLGGGVYGACHALDAPFVFGTHLSEFCGSGPLADRLSASMQDAWIAFARNGDPSCARLGRWPQYGEKRETMILGKNCYIENAPFDEERAAWDYVGEVSPAKAMS